MSSAGAPAVTAEEMDAMLNQAFTEYDMDQSGCAFLDRRACSVY
jgi:hypothetical protein